MKKLLVAALSLLAIAVPAQDRQLQSTTWSRTFLRSTNNADAWTKIGIVASNQNVVSANGINTAQLSTNSSVLQLKAGGTLPAMDAAALTNMPPLTNATIRAWLNNGSSTNIDIVFYTSTNLVDELDDTNVLYVTGSTEPGVNGTYKIKFANGSDYVAYTNSDGMYFIYEKPPQVYENNVYSIGPNTNSKVGFDTLYYQDTGDAEGQWNGENGGAPLPAALWQTNKIYRVSAGLTNTLLATPLFPTNVFYVDPVNGNDSFGQPYKTLNHAVSVSAPGALFYLAKGNHVLNGPAWLKDGSTVIGSGTGTTITGSVAHANIYLTNNCRVYSARFDLSLNLAIEATNVFIHDVHTRADVDGIYARSSETGGGQKWQLTADSCSFYSGWDAVIFEQQNWHANYSADVTLVNCDINSQFDTRVPAGQIPTFNGAHTIAIDGRTRLTVIGGRMYVRGGPSADNACIRILGTNRTGWIDIAGSALDWATIPGTNGTTAMINYQTPTAATVPILNTNYLVAGNLLAYGASILNSNSVASWPTAPAYYGQSSTVNSNGVVYLLCSPPNQLAWTKTNLLGTP
jgi:hypothetical protein